MPTSEPEMSAERAAIVLDRIMADECSSLGHDQLCAIQAGADALLALPALRLRLASAEKVVAAARSRKMTTTEDDGLDA
jgi:hypothetical protein